MQSFLIVGGKAKERREKAENFLTGIAMLDVTTLEGETIGISEIRHLIHFLLLKPIQSENKAALIFEAQTLTIEAQHALLKTLEEPPGNTTIILTAPNPELLLSTIVSRCQVIELQLGKAQLTEQELRTPPPLASLAFGGNSELRTLMTGGLGERLKLAQDLSKSREDAISLLEEMILVARQKMIEAISNDRTDPSISQYHTIVLSLQKTYTTISTTNVNLRLVLENLILNL